jgi:DNA-binding transcriptional regulator YiaG
MFTINMEVTMDYQRLVKELREKLILSQQEFANFIGVSLRLLIDGKLENTSQP